MSLIALLFSIHTGHAAGSCLSSFAANLSRINTTMNSLSAACKNEVLKGEGNAAQISAACNSSEMSKVMMIRDNRDANRNLCQQDGCKAELNNAKVCVKGQSMKYYMNQVRKN